MKRIYSKEDEIKIIKMYQEGKSLVAVAKEIGFGSYTTVNNVLIKNGIPKRNFVENKTHSDLVISLYNEGKSLATIANETKIGCTGTINNILIRNNISKRGRGDWHKAYIENEFFFETIDTEEKAYFLGFIMADGCIRERDAQNRLSIEIHKRDAYILEKFKEVLGLENNVRTTRKDHRIIDLHSNKICNDLANYGVVPRKSMKETFPHLITDEMKRHFIRGYFDGDGWATNTTSHGKRKGSRKAIGFCGGKNIMADLSQYLTKKLGLYPMKLVKKKESDLYYILYSSKKDTETLTKYFYENATIYLTRKKEKCEYVYVNTEGS